MRWGDNARDHDPVLASWPSYRPLLGRWMLEELVETGDGGVHWRDRRVPTSEGHVKMDVHASELDAQAQAELLNAEFERSLRNRSMSSDLKTSLQLKVAKSVQAKQRLAREEALMLAEARRRHAASPRPPAGETRLAESSAQYRDELEQQLADMPYLWMVLAGPPGRRVVLYRGSDGQWSKPYHASERAAKKAFRAKIANGFGMSHETHWGQTKARIRQLLLPRANQLLQLASVKRLLAEALAAGKHVLVSNDIVFWYEEEGGLGWQVKQTAAASSGEAEALWREGTIYSTNHGRLVILPYIKENGERVRGHTRNAPNDGRAMPRHPDHYVEIPFEQLSDDLMIGLFGELPYE